MEEKEKRRWLVVNEKGEKEWVDQQPVWKRNSKGKEGVVGFLPDGRKVRKANWAKKGLVKKNPYLTDKGKIRKNEYGNK